MHAVSAFAPATVANVGVGFDVLGLAIDGPGDTVTAYRSDTPGVRIRRVTGGDLPLEAERNTAGVAAISTLRLAGVDVGVELELHKGLPIGSGLGSSSSSAAAAAFAVNLLLGSPLRKAQLIEPCMDAEEAVSGRHADNVAPSLLGGLILVRSTDPLDIVRLPIPEGLTVAVVTPDFVLTTKAARAALPASISLATMVRQTANIAGLVSACYTGDLDLLARCIPETVVTPVRAQLIPGGAAAIEAALEAGALGASVSGAGPSIFALCRSVASAQAAATAMQAAFTRAGLASTRVVSPADAPGARRVDLPA